MSLMNIDKDVVKSWIGLAVENLDQPFDKSTKSLEKDKQKQIREAVLLEKM